MSTLDPTLFADAADALGISSPTIVEKDYFAIQLLRELKTINFPEYQLVFSGGTCLAKAYQNIYRMSEDIDIKLVPKKPTLRLSREKQRNLRRNIYQTVIALLEQSTVFNLITPTIKRNEGCYQQFLIEYPNFHGSFDALRPHLQLDLTESLLLQPPVNKPLRSLYAEVAELQPEVDDFLCVTVESAASEKFVSLLRRTAAFARDNSKADDATLIRHAYDLHLIANNLSNLNSIANLVHQVIEIDVAQFGNQHPEFKQKPIDELRFGLGNLQQNPIHQARYQKFIGPLVYHPEPADWKAVLNTLVKLAKLVFSSK